MPNVPHRAVRDTAEGRRLAEADLPAPSADAISWRRFGPYLSDRQWGTVREDYSADGDAWNYLPHDHARSRAYRWGEDAIAGFGDDQLAICLGLALWNGCDPILKERLFGLNNGEGNHGEDVKELYYYLDGTPTHSYMRMLYKYPQAAYPYADLLATNARRSLDEREYELIDTGVFADDRYFDAEVEYAKGAPDDILMQVTITNRGDRAATLHVLPQLWSRNTWSWGATERTRKPKLAATSATAIAIDHPNLPPMRLDCDARGPGLGRMGSTLMSSAGTPGRSRPTRPGPRPPRITRRASPPEARSSCACACAALSRQVSRRMPSPTSMRRWRSGARSATPSMRPCRAASPTPTSAWCSARPLPACCGPNNITASTFANG